MRTVSFSDPNLQNLLNSRFVNTYTNTKGDPTSGSSVWHEPGEPAGNCIRGNGQQNVQTIFMTPEGQIFHVATGYLPAEHLFQEANFALHLFDQIKRLEADADIEKLISDAHQHRLSQLGFDDSAIQATSEMDRIRQVANGMRTSPGSSDDMFQRFSQRQILDDHQFSIKHPRMSYQQLESNPATLVGNGKTFFCSQSSSSNSRR